MRDFKAHQGASGAVALERAMAIYHFHDADGVRNMDAQGVELPDDAAAQLEAVMFAGGLLRDDPKKLWAKGQWRVEVTDRNNILLFTVITLAVDAPKPDFVHYPRNDGLS